MENERFDVYIGPNYDMIVDKTSNKSYNGIEIAKILNQYDKEIKKYQRALRLSIEEKQELEKNIKYLKHEVFGCG